MANDQPPGAPATERQPGAPATERLPGAPATERQSDAHSLLAILGRVSDNVQSGQNEQWNFSINAPRWSFVPEDRGSRQSLAGAGLAILLTGSALLLAWHASDELARHKSGLAAQIGPWVVIGILLLVAGAAAFTAFSGQRLHVRITQLSGSDAAAAALAASTSAPGRQTSQAASPQAAGSAAAAQAHASEATRLAAQATQAAGDADPAAAAAAASAASAHAAAANAAGATAASSAVASKSSGKNPATTISPKVWAGSIAGAVSFSFWTIAAATFWKHTFTADALAALVGSTTTLVSALAAHFKVDPLRVKAD